MMDLLLVTWLHGTLLPLVQQQPNILKGLPDQLDISTTWTFAIVPLYALAKSKQIPGGRRLLEGLAVSLTVYVWRLSKTTTSNAIPFSSHNYIQSSALYILLTILSSLYTAFLGPLASIPGPLFAKLSSYYLPYHLLYRSTNFTTLFARLHEEYGPVVRIAPDEVHVHGTGSDSVDAYNKIYTQRFDKEPALYKCFGEDESSFGELTYAAAKARKDRLSGLFTRSGVKGLEHVVRENVERTVSRLVEECATTKSSTDFLLAMKCLAVDVITTFCFAQKIDASGAKGFQAPIIMAMEASLFNFLVFMNFPLINKIIFSLPPWLSRITAPELGGLFDLQELLQRQIDDIKEDPGRLESVPHKTIYHPLLLDKGPDTTKKSLYEEGQAMLFGGTDTVSNTLMLLVYYVLSTPGVEEKLLKELKGKGVWEDLGGEPPSWDTLERLPYLSAVIKEALRLTPGVAAAQKRVVGQGGFEVQGGWQIPEGSIIHSSAFLVNTDGKLWPEPRKFRPERWLVESKEERRNMEANLVTFSKGPRMCMGMNLAYCELYIAVATLFRKLDMKIDGTTEEDIWTYRECFIPWYYGKHLRIIAKESAD
ncbi:cytochrome P450 monooxygenase-like protein [Naviculisporaceae sp. PSN 640]